MKNVLLLTDFSKNARNSISYGITLFKEDANYTLLNACIDPTMNTDTLISVRDILQEKSENGLEADLHFIEDQFHLPNLKIKSRTEYGTIDSIFEDVASDEDFDFVVMGTKGKTAESWMVGSATETVTRHSQVPVIIVPDKVVYKEINSIVYASNLYEDESFLISSVVNFAKFSDASLTILHVDKSPSSAVESAHKFNEIKNRTPYSKLNFVELVEDDVEDAIVSYVENNKIDLLALTTYTTTLMKRIFHKSVTKNLIHHMHIPMLIFNRKKYSYIFLG